MIDHAESIRASFAHRRAALRALRTGEMVATEGDAFALKRWLRAARAAMARAVGAYRMSRLTGHYLRIAGTCYAYAVVREADGSVAWTSGRYYGKRQSAQRAAKREAEKRMVTNEEVARVFGVIGTAIA